MLRLRQGRELSGSCRLSLDRSRQRGRRLSLGVRDGLAGPSKLSRRSSLSLSRRLSQSRRLSLTRRLSLSRRLGLGVSGRRGLG